MTTWISDEEAEKALNWLVTNARALGDAKEKAVLSEAMRKRVKAIQMKRSEATSAAAQERDADASDAMLEAITDDAKASGHLEYMRALKDAAVARIEAWRSLTATQRAMSK